MNFYHNCGRFPIFCKDGKIKWQPLIQYAVLTVLGNNTISDDQFKKLIEGCIKNHRKSQETVYKLFYGKMMAVCRRYTRNEDQAKDILQDSFIKVFKNMDRFNFEGSFEGWVRRIVVNTAIDFTRKSKRDYLLMNESNSIESEEENLLYEEDEEDYSIPLKVGDVINAMEKLSPAYRTVFNLYVFENYTHQEIADSLDISVGTSKSNLAKARANMKKILTKELEKRDGKSAE